jgi:hypothetical protein
MVCFRPLSRLARPLATACLAAALGLVAGCTTTKFAAVQNAMKEAIAADEKPAPASQFACWWTNRLGSLPDPTKNGTTTPGVIGQVFLYTPDFKPADVNGDLTITVHDTTPRPPGAAAVRPEAWHFGKDVLKNMVADDDRFGRSLVVFLPWPDHWRDVNRLYIQARYDQAGGQTLYAQPTTVTLDFSAPGSGLNPMAGGMPAVPDPAVLVRQARAAHTPMAAPPAAANAATPNPAAGYGVTYPPGVQPVAYPPPQAPVPPPNELAVPRGR